MDISATIKRTSHVAAMWRSRSQTHGLLSNVRFNRRPDGIYEATSLAAHQVEALRHNSAVEISFIGAAPPDTNVPPPPSTAALPPAAGTGRPVPAPRLAAASRSTYRPKPAKN